MLQFHDQAKVVAADGKAVGEVDRVVIDPKTREVDYVVVRKGTLFPTDKVVPVAVVSEATPEQVTLKVAADEMEDWPDFEEREYVPLDESEQNRAGYAVGSSAGYIPAPAFYWYPGLYRGPLFAPGYLGPRQDVVIKENIPDHTVALKKGAKVFDADGQDVGNIEEVIVAPDTNRATHFAIAQGVLLKERKLVPASWIGRIGEEEVHLTVGAGLLNRLPPYTRMSSG